MQGMIPRAPGPLLFFLDPAGLYFAISSLTTIAEGMPGLQTRGGASGLHARGMPQPARVSNRSIRRPPEAPLSHNRQCPMGLRPTNR